MMGGRTPETCRAVNKRQDIKLEKCCIWLVIYLTYTMMRGLTNLKFIGPPVLKNIGNPVEYLIQRHNLIQTLLKFTSS
jgi:hypothetical protein